MTNIMANDHAPHATQRAPIQPISCGQCPHVLPSILAPGDHRCAGMHRNGLAAPTAAYPTIEWMRSPAALCGPLGALSVSPSKG
jgi:hypothetical protein